MSFFISQIVRAAVCASIFSFSVIGAAWAADNSVSSAPGVSNGRPVQSDGSTGGGVSGGSVGGGSVESGVSGGSVGSGVSGGSVGKRFVCPARPEIACRAGMISQIRLVNGCRVQSCLPAKKPGPCMARPEQVCQNGTISNVRMVNGCKVQSCDAPNQNKVCPMLAILCKPGEKAFVGENCAQSCVIDNGVQPVGNSSTPAN